MKSCVCYEDPSKNLNHRRSDCRGLVWCPWHGRLTTCGAGILCGHWCVSRLPHCPSSSWLMCWESREGWPKFSGPCSCMGGLDGSSGSEMVDGRFLCFSLPLWCNSAFQITIKSKILKKKKKDLLVAVSARGSVSVCWTPPRPRML